MTKQNKNRKKQATLEEMVKSGSQIVLVHDDGSEQPIEEIIEANQASQYDSSLTSSTIRDGGISSEAHGCSRRDDGGRDQNQSRRCLGMR